VLYYLRDLIRSGTLVGGGGVFIWGMSPNLHFFYFFLTCDISLKKWIFCLKCQTLSQGIAVERNDLYFKANANEQEREQ